MRHQRRETQPTSAFRGGELRWLATGILMLIVLFILISQLRQPGALGWLSSIDHLAVKPQASPPATPLPKATGPTDEDPDQAEESQSELQAMSDGTLSLGGEEMVPYNRLVFWAKNQSFARLWSRAKQGLAYTYLHDSPSKYRGKLVALDVEIRLVRDAEKNEHGIPLHEVWATTQQSGDRLYDLLVMDLPSKISVGSPIREKAKFAGYFLKLQGYQPALSKPGLAPEKAPLLIGRLEWTPSPTPPQDDFLPSWTWGLVGLAIVIVVLIAPFMFRKLGRRKPASRGILTPSTGEVIPIDHWLEHSGFGPPDDGENAENSQNMNGCNSRNDQKAPGSPDRA